MHEVVPSAVSAAVSAAIAMRITTSQKFFFISFNFYIVTFLNYSLLVASLKIFQNLF